MTAGPAVANCCRPGCLLISEGVRATKGCGLFVSRCWVNSALEVMTTIWFAKKARGQTPDLIVLDVMLPEMDGFEICKTLRLDPTTLRVPIIMVTAKAAEIDRVLGLELGADDYLTKPFSTRELLLRIKKILSRGQTAEPADNLLRFGDLTIDAPRHIASWREKPFDLTATEFKLLTILAQRAGRVQSRDQLLRDVWEYDSLIDTRTVDTHMRRLREKLGPASRYLETVRGIGYRFAAES